MEETEKDVNDVKLMRGYKNGQEDPQRMSGRFDKAKTIAGYRSTKLEDNAHIVEILEENERLRFENESLTKKVEAQEKQIQKLEDDVQLLEDKVDTHKLQYEETLKDHIQSPQSSRTSNGEINGDTKDRGCNSRSSTLPLAYRLQHHEVELQIVKDALSSLRRCFPVHDPFQHTLDTIEESLATLTERVSAVENVPHGENEMECLSQFSANRDSRRTPISIRDFTNNPHYITSVHEPQTKVVYFLSKSTTPFLSSINKRIGEITLKDFKIVLDRPGQFRYHFKTLDREYGMVKEEVLHDDDVLPGWDNKIIGWVEEDD